MKEELKMNECRRQKYWVELTDTEKIERLRTAVKALKAQNEYFQKLINLLMSHQHNGSGDLVAGLRACLPSEIRGRAVEGDDVYL